MHLNLIYRVLNRFSLPIELVNHKIVVLLLLAILNLAACRQTPKTEAPELATSPTPLISPAIPSPSPNPQAAAKLRQQGLNYRQQSRFPDAIAALEEAVQLDPENISGRVLFGWTLHLAGKETEAAQALNEALIQDPEHVPALNALGIVYLVDAQLKSAVATHERAIELKPDNEIAHYNLALAYHRLEDYEPALDRGKQATILEPNNPHPWVAVALVYWSEGNRTEAQQAYRTAKQLDSRYQQSSYLSHLIQAGFTDEQIAIVEEIRTSQ